MLHQNMPNRAQLGYAERFARTTGGPAARGPAELTQTGIPSAWAWSVGQGAVGFWLLGEGPREKREGQLEAEAYHLPCSALMPNRWMALSDNIPG